MTADYVAESAETLAEALWTRFGFPSDREWEELPREDRDDWCKDAAALIASSAVRPAAEVRAEAWDEGWQAGRQRVVGGQIKPNPYRAALAEEGGRSCNCGYGGYHEPLNPRCELNAEANQ